ncbi:hypothetical protein ACFV6Y_39315 [Streptomyces massasporeus]|uniref:hypothetical protein n=1 Tax=Streptomyces massasporeus TaxID=67324 RepID=UPI00365FA8C0
MKIKQQLPLILISMVVAIVMVANNVHYWWAWSVWAVVLLAQIAVAAGLDDKLDEQNRQPYVPAHIKRQQQRDI